MFDEFSTFRAALSDADSDLKSIFNFGFEPTGVIYYFFEKRMKLYQSIYQKLEHKHLNFLAGMQ